LRKILTDLQQGKSVEKKASGLQVKKSKSMYVKPLEDSVVVVFPVHLDDENDATLAVNFLQVSRNNQHRKTEGRRGGVCLGVTLASSQSFLFLLLTRFCGPSLTFSRLVPALCGDEEDAAEPRQRALLCVPPEPSA